MQLKIEKIEKFLHQKYPFLMIDKIIDYEKEKKVIAIKNVSYNEPFFKGHFPDEKIMPGTLISEAMAQAAIFLFYDETKEAPLYYLASTKTRFLAPVIPGDQIQIKVVPIKLIKGSGIAKAEAFVGDKKVATGELSFKAKP